MLSKYNSLDVSLDVSIDNRAWFPDLGFEAQTNHERLVNLMHSGGFDVVSDFRTMASAKAALGTIACALFP